MMHVDRISLAGARRRCPIVRTPACQRRDSIDLYRLVLSAGYVLGHVRVRSAPVANYL